MKEKNRNLKKVLYVSPTAPDVFNELLDGFIPLKEYLVYTCFKEFKSRDFYDNPLRIYEKFFEKIRLPIDNTFFNKRILQTAKKDLFDIVIFVKGNAVYPWTLIKLRKILPNAKFISWSKDDMFSKHNRSIYYSYGLKLYDLVVTTKSFNANKDELPSIGAKVVLFQNNAYSPNLHKPFSSKQKSNFEIVFIGTAEKDRFEYLVHAGKNRIPISIYGSGWKKFEKQLSLYPSLNLHLRNLPGKEYSQKIADADVAIAFLRKMNRDLQTGRSIEIPACRTAMVSEYTSELAEIFEDQKNIKFFRNKQEFINSLKLLMNDKSLTKQISNNGYRLIKDNSFTYTNRLEEMIEVAYNEG